MKSDTWNLFNERAKVENVVNLVKECVSCRPCLFREKVARDDGLYLRATSRGFCNMVVGVHILEKTLPMMMKEAGIEGKFTLHSLRSTCATRLYEKGVDEQIIQEVTGHSSNAVRAYKRTSDGMRANVSSILQCAGGVVEEEKKGWIMCSQVQSVQNVVVAGEVTNLEEEAPLKKMTAAPMFSNCTFSNCSISF